MLRSLALVLISMTLVGCDARIERFEPNDVYALTLARSRAIPADAATEDASGVLEALFGTPDGPRWPDLLSGDNPLVDSKRLAEAAGPVSSEKDGTQRGLFREHCVTCHGLAGTGAGPASLFQNPYPRDFRHGVFKWKSTDRGSKPTRDDLRRHLKLGIPGTAMPSFTLLRPGELDALVDYVIYLSVRGEVERRLITAAIDQLDYAETPPEDELRLNHSGQSEGAEVVLEIVSRVDAMWQDAESNVVQVPAFPTLEGQPLQQSILQGKEIFHGKVANCVGCHGRDGNGELVTLDYDDWSKEYSTRIGVTPGDREAMQPLRDAGALTPRPIKPRNLQHGVFRGGGDAETLFRRITQGIVGTPMPAVELVAEDNGLGLTEDQVWDLVRYVQSLAR
jgi:mono/diheme cytochrome c family protein